MKKFDKTTFLLILILLAGLSFLLYPSFSDWWNGRYQSYAIESYSEEIAKMDSEEYKAIWESAKAYNESLLGRRNDYVLTQEQMAAYNNELNLHGSGIMGYIEIPDIDVSLAIYHTTEETVLQVAVGHLEWTSLPTGGPGTHCVLSGHRGLPSAKLFTDLDRLEIGDRFILHIMDEVLTYEVDQIKVVEPQETEDLLIQPGQDLVTLVTCTPYGVNSHRLLVRGHRVDNAPVVTERHVTADAVQTDPMVVASVLAIPLVTIGVIGMFIADGIGNRRSKKEKKSKEQS